MEEIKEVRGGKRVCDIRKVRDRRKVRNRRGRSRIEVRDDRRRIGLIIYSIILPHSHSIFFLFECLEK